jgi:dTDP-4-amino-4,6-dideoxygalactose transaminase
VLHAGAEVVFCDVEPDTGLMDLNQVEHLLKTTPDVKAIIPVHLYGQMVDMRAFKQLADKYGVKILEDCAHCIEGERDGVRPGQLGDAAAFSFYATKNLACGEGGAVLTNDAHLAEMLRVIRQHGMSKSAADRHVHYQHWDMEVLGYKCNLTDIQSALLAPQLARVDQTLEKKEKICRKYEKAFSKLKNISFPQISPSG